MLLLKNSLLTGKKGIRNVIGRQPEFPIKLYNKLRLIGDKDSNNEKVGLYSRVMEQIIPRMEVDMLPIKFPQFFYFPLPTFCQSHLIINGVVVPNVGVLEGHVSA